MALSTRPNPGMLVVGSGLAFKRHSLTAEFRYSGIMLGTPLSVRSDEWATSTPALLRVMATGSTDDLNPLTADDQIIHSLGRAAVNEEVVASGHSAADRAIA